MVACPTSTATSLAFSAPRNASCSPASTRSTRSPSANSAPRHTVYQNSHQTCSAAGNTSVHGDRADLIASVRAHLYNCAILPATVLQRLREAREVAQRLVDVMHSYKVR